MNHEIQNQTEVQMEHKGPGTVTPRCLATVPSDIDVLVEEFKAQGLL